MCARSIYLMKGSTTSTAHVDDSLSSHPFFCLFCFLCYCCCFILVCCLFNLLRVPCRCCGMLAGEGTQADAAPPTSSDPPSRPSRASATLSSASAWTAWTTQWPTPCCSSRGRTSRYAGRGRGVGFSWREAYFCVLETGWNA